MDQRERWACPDIKVERPHGRFLTVPGSTYDFPECPAAFLRTVVDVQALRERRGIDAWADHLIEGVTHPDNLAAEAASELESGARTAESLSAKLHALAQLRMSEVNDRSRYESEMREEARRGRGN